MFFRMMCALAIVAMTAAAGYAAAPSSSQATLPAQPQGSEIAFVQGIQKDLMARFPTPADAERAGYFRYGNEDEDGAISYANLHWQSGSPRQPSQLWYSVHGKLLGADFSVLQSKSPEPPKMWGVDFRRWVSFSEHIHYVLVGAGGGETYGGVKAAKFADSGGNVENPQPETLVKMGVVKNVAQVKRLFLFPSLWDLIVWLTPNPLGAFADKNPLVKPSADAGKDEM